MNIVQLHEKVRFWTDTVSSPRFDQWDIDNAINSIGDAKIEEAYSEFQKTQKIRDQLSTHVQKKVKTGGSGLYITMDASYRYLLSIKVLISNQWYTCEPLSYDMINKVDVNPFRKPRTSPSKKAYYTEENGMIRVIAPEGVTDLANYELYYLKNPLLVNYGTRAASTTLTFSTSKTYIAEMDNTTYRIGATYYPAMQIGQEVTPSVGGEGSVNTGALIYDYVDCDLRSSMHEDIAIQAAALLLRRPVDVLRNKTN